MEKKTQTTLLQILLVLVSLWCIACQICKAATGDSFLLSTGFVLISLSLLFSLFYVLVSYKEPHGNLLRYVILSYCVATIIAIGILTEATHPVYVLLACVLFLMSYMAGKLNKLKQNIVILILAFGCQVAAEILTLKTNPVASVFMFPLAFEGTIECLVIGAAYLLRYQEHKKAGQEDAPEA